jgi:ABC-type branched-subunit amino acid transport system substrate-binding protein
MKKSLYWILVLVLSVALLAACGPTEAPPQPTEPPAAEQPTTAVEQPTEARAPAAEEQTMVIGFTTSQTGSYNVSSLRQVNGLTLWMNEVNSAGGIQLSDGTIVKFESVTYDDESTKERVQELYTRLSTEDNADFLISPYSSGLTAAAALIAEQYGKIMITTGAASDSTYKEGYTLVFQAYTPASRYLTGAVDLLAATDANVTKLAFVYENDQFSTDVVNAAKEYAESEGYEIVLFEGYDSETKDFGPFINKILESGAEAILGGGHFQDGSTFARQIQRSASWAPASGSPWPSSHRNRLRQPVWNGLGPWVTTLLRPTKPPTMKSHPTTRWVAMRQARFSRRPSSTPTPPILTPSRPPWMLWIS